MIKIEKGLFKDLVALFFPVVCPGCQTRILSGEAGLCLSCRAELNFCRFACWPANPMETSLEGRIDIEAACALLYFERQALVQRLIHALKYHGRQELGSLFGSLLGNEILDSKRFQGVDCIVNVPLHPLKIRTRGYNQTTVFSQCLSSTLSRPLFQGILRRRGRLSSQTVMNRAQRTDLLSQCFYLMDAEVLAGKHVLLVDDVVTTGATLEACAKCLIAVPGLKLSVATMAFTR